MNHMSKSLTLMDKLRIYGQWKGVQKAMQTKNSTQIMAAVIALLTCIAQTGWAQSIVGNTVHTHPALAVLLSGITGILALFHVPVKTESESGSGSGPGSSTRPSHHVGPAILAAILLLTVAHSIPAHAQGVPSAPADLTYLYAAGVSGNPSSDVPVSGTALYAHRISDSNTYSFSVIDLLPNASRPGTLTTNISTGVAQKMLTVRNIPIYASLAAGLQMQSGDTGWNWNGGGLAAIRWKQTNVYILPNVRFLKGSVSNGTGYQLLPGLAIGWGE